MDAKRTIALLLTAAAVAACGGQPAAQPPAPAGPAAGVPDVVTRLDRGPREERYWTKARLTALEQSKADFVPPPPQSDAGGAAPADGTNPGEDTTPVEDPPAPPTPMPEPSPAPSQPAPQPTSPPDELTEQEQRFRDELTRLDEGLKEGAISVDEAIVALEKMLEWPDLTEEQRELLKVNIRHLERIVRERDRSKLD